MSTLGDQMTQVRETEGRAAVYRALVSHLRARYIGRDSIPPVASVRSVDGSAVAEEIVELIARELEVEASDFDRAARATKAIEVLRG